MKPQLFHATMFEIHMDPETQWTWAHNPSTLGPADYCVASDICDLPKLTIPYLILCPEKYIIFLEHKEAYQSWLSSTSPR